MCDVKVFTDAFWAAQNHLQEHNTTIYCDCQGKTTFGNYILCKIFLKKKLYYGCIYNCMRIKSARTLKTESHYGSYTGYIDSVHLAYLYIKWCIAQPANTQNAGNGP